MQKKILIIGPTPPPYNGMSVITDIILNSSLSTDYEIIHLDIADRRTVSNIGQIDFINIWLAIKHFLEFVYLCVVKKPDLIYLPIAQNTAGYSRDSLFLIPSRLLNIKTVIHLHGSHFRNFHDNSNILFKNIIRFTLSKVRGAIVLGNCLKDIFKGIISEDKIFVVPNGIGDEFNGFVKNYSANKIVQILFLSNLCAAKGLFEILEAIPSIIKDNKNVKFVFAGDWFSEEDKKKANKIIEQNDIKQYVEFVGVISGDKKKEYLKNSDIFLIIPTHYPFEGQPLVILEAMSAGLPVVSTNKGAIRETVVNEENGFLIEVKNTFQLVEKITILSYNLKMREMMGKRSREIFLEKFTKEKFVKTLVNVFKEVVKS